LEAAGDFALRMKTAWQEAESALKKAAEDMARFADVHRNEAPDFKVGDKVWLDRSDIKTKRPAKKMDDRRLGPFAILKKVSRSAYVLKLPASLSRLHPVFNVSKLRQFNESTIPGQKTDPPPPIELEDGDKAYEVEEILNSKLFGKTLKYLIKWKGYTAEHNTYEPPSNIDAPRAIAEFHKKHPSAPRKVNFADLDFRPLVNFTDNSVPANFCVLNSMTLAHRAWKSRLEGGVLS